MTPFQSPTTRTCGAACTPLKRALSSSTEDTTAGLVLARYPRHSLAAIKAAIPRRLGYAVCPDPIMNDPVRDDDPAHALICPPGIGSGKIKANAREMAQAAAWVVLRNPPY